MRQLAMSERSYNSLYHRVCNPGHGVLAKLEFVHQVMGA
jgi:hypothetical protein